jgi:hypothetical protein
VKKSAAILTTEKMHHEASTGKVRRRRLRHITATSAAFRTGPAAQSTVSRKGSFTVATPTPGQYLSAHRPRNDKNEPIALIVVTINPLGGGLVPPGASAKADVVAARRAAERARVRNVRDMVKAPGADALQEG